MDQYPFGKASHTSAAAVIRLCHTLGLTGYKDFRIQYAKELAQEAHSQPVDADLPFDMNDSAARIAEKLEALVSHSLADAKSILMWQKPSLERTVDAMVHAGKVGIFGAGDAYIEGLSFQAQMLRAGFNYLCTPVYGEQRHLAQTFGEKDCALVLSCSGTTTRVNQVAAELCRRE